MAGRSRSQGGDEGGGGVEGVVIPIRESDMKVHILPEDLPEDGGSEEFDHILQVLQAELASPRVWTDLAEAYYAKGRPDMFRLLLDLLLQGLQEENVKLAMTGTTVKDKERFEEELLRVYNKLAADSSMEATKKKRVDDQARQEYWDRAKDFYDKADNVRRYAEQTLMNMGWTVLNLGDGDSWRRSDYWFTNANKEAEDRGRTNLMAVLGMAIMAFHYRHEQRPGEKLTPQQGMEGEGGDYRRARRLFGKVIRAYPGCPASVRVGFGLCCYKLGEMDRAKAAFRRALMLQPGNKAALLALARTELAEAEPKDYLKILDRVIKMQTAAFAQDPTDPGALNSLANFYLHKWFALPARGAVIESSHDVTEEVEGDKVVTFEQGDLIRLGEHFVARVVSVGPDGGSLKLDRPYHARASDASESSLPIYRKNFRQAMELADRSMRFAEFTENRAESLYIKARVYHQLEDFDSALEFYSQAAETCPDLAPAQYGLAQMLAAASRALALKERKEEAAQRLAQAIEALNKVMNKVPNDPEALTLLGLLLAEQNKLSSDKTQALEKLKRAVDLRPDVKETWIALAQVHQREPADLKEALRCQQEAETLMLAKQEPISASLLSNLGALFHVRGDSKEAKDYYFKALEAYASTGGSGLGVLESRFLDKEEPIFHPSNSVFWEWEKLPITIKPSKGSREGVIDDGGWKGHLQPGDCIKLEIGPRPRDAFVTEVSKEDADDAPPGSIPFKHAFILHTPDNGAVVVYKKKSRGLLRHETLTTVFNLATIHQDVGELSAAEELFLAIIHQYPSYVAAHVKLGLLYQAQGRHQKAHAYLHKAREIAPTDRDVLATCGKMEQDAGRRDQAQKIFEPLNKEGDPFAMVALGQMYFMNAITVQDKAHHIGHSKIYNIKVLKKEPRNLYAAHGLGLVLAEEYGKIDEARSVLQTLREKSGDKPDEVLINIAHLFVAQRQLNAAIHCYETYLKKKTPGPDGLPADVYEFIAHAHFLEKTYDKGLRSILKAAHIEPTKPKVLFDVAICLEESALEVFKRARAEQTKSVEESRRAEQDMFLAIAIYSQPDIVQALPSKAKDHGKFLKENVELARKYVVIEETRFMRDEVLKNQQTERLARERQEKEQKKRAKEEEEKKKKEQATQEALQREEALRKLTSQWAQEPKEPVKAKKGKGKDKDNKDELEESDDESEVNEPLLAREGKEDEDSSSDEEEDEGPVCRSAAALPPAATDKEEEEGGGGGASSGEEYGFKSFKKDKAKARAAQAEREAEAAAAAAAAASSAAGGGTTEPMDVGEEAESHKRKAAGAEESLPKKRRIQRGGDSDESDEDELDLGASSGSSPSKPAAAAAASASLAPSSSSAAAAAAMPEEGGGGGGGGGARRKKVAMSDDEESDNEEEGGGGGIPVAASEQQEEEAEVPAPVPAPTEAAVQQEAQARTFVDNLFDDEDDDDDE